jgi:2-dehydropantoate 2-reductase
MQEKKIAVIGVGGRTGTMFCFELKDVANVLGIGKEIKKKLLIEKKKGQTQPFEGRIILDSQWSLNDFSPDIIFLAIKNPVGQAIKYYYQRMKEKGIFPTLILSQNGVAAISDSISALKEIFGSDYEKIRIVRLNLFNPIDRKQQKTEIIVNYSLPIRISFGKVSGPGSLKDIQLLFKNAGFETTEFSQDKIRDMELSKLFFNLIGIPSATSGLGIKQGFENSETFTEEFKALKEYIRVIKKSGNSFINFPKYYVKWLTLMIHVLPIPLLLLFRKNIAKIITKGREGKPKDLTEIKYYNGFVVDLGERLGVPTPINQKIVNRVLK